MNTVPHTSSLPPLKSVQACFSESTLRSSPLLSSYYFFRDLVIFAILSSALWNAEGLWLLPLWILLGLNTFGLFQIGHETAHGSLFRNKTLSWWVGQIAFLPSLHPYNQWVYGHNLIHHCSTIRLRGDLAWHPRSPERYARMSFLEKIIHRVYWSAFGGGLYYLVKMWLQGLIVNTADFPGAKRDTRLVMAFGLLTTTVIFFASGHSPSGFDWRAALWMVLKLQVIPFLILNYLIGITVYLHHIDPDIPWKSGDEWSTSYAQISGSKNYALPVWINFFIHHIFVHAPHHIQPAIPFYNLPAALNELDLNYSAHLHRGKDILGDYLKAIRKCKLFDTTSGCWVGYP